MTLIIGAGLSGLLTAYRLKKEGISFKILEARPRIGGRINTVYGSENTPIEMGATWFTHQHQNLKTLLDELDLEYFEQYMDHTVRYQASTNSAVQTVQIPSQSPSYRISGGTSHLINTLFEKLDATDVLLNQTVTEIKFHKNSVEVIAKDTFKGDRIVLALPPKLWAKKMVFEPPLPNDLMRIAAETHTWMEDSIKIALTYKKPFWQEEHIPGTFFSTSGPITEFYDHCNHQRSKYALCGFINSSFNTMSETERRALVMKQITDAFGVKAKEFMDYKECLWSNEDHTFEASDVFLFPHQNNGNPVFNTSFFDDRLFISGAESASKFAGYMDGAVYSGNVTAERIIEEIRLSSSF